MSDEQVWDEAGICSVVDAVVAFRSAFEGWLETQVVRRDPTPSQTQPVTRTRPGVDDQTVGSLARDVSRWTEDASIAVDLAAAQTQAPDVPGLSAVREWASLTTPAARITPDDVLNELDDTERILRYLLSLPSTEGPLLPVPDPTRLHPYVWSNPVLMAWLNSDEARIPLWAAKSVQSLWAHRLNHPQFPEGRFWDGLLSASPPGPREPRLRPLGGGSLTEPGAHQSQLRAALLDLSQRSHAYDSSPGAPTLARSDLEPWLTAWSDLAGELERCHVVGADGATQQES